jgi:hypothetical protein
LFYGGAETDRDGKSEENFSWVHDSEYVMRYKAEYFFDRSRGLKVLSISVVVAAGLFVVGREGEVCISCLVYRIQSAPKMGKSFG